MLTNIVYTLALFLNAALIGLVVVTRPHSKTHRTFAAFVSLMFAWGLFALLAEYAQSAVSALFYLELATAAGLASPLFFLWYVRAFLAKCELRVRPIVLASATTATVVNCAIALLSAPILDARTSGYGIVLTDYTIWLPVATAVSALLYVAALQQLRRASSALNGVYRRQIHYVTVSVAATMLLNIALVAGSYIVRQRPEIYVIGTYPLTALAMLVLFVGVMRARLFDIRPIVFRSVGYLLSVMSICLMVSVFIAAFAQAVNRANTVTFNQVFLLVFGCLAAGALFWPLKKLFDALTQRVFHRYTYSTRAVQSELGDHMIASSDLGELLPRSLDLYANALRPTHAGLIALDEDFTVLASERRKQPVIEISRELVESIPKKTYVLYRHKTTGAHRAFMREHDIQLMRVFVAHRRVVGLLLLGPKETGSSYTLQDRDLLAISGKNFALAIAGAQLFAKISEFNTSLNAKVNYATKQLRANNRELKRLDKAKDEFVSMASHQLRTPLTAIKSLTLLLRDQHFGKTTEAQAEALDDSLIATERMVGLVDEMLHVSRIEAGNFTVAKQSVHLSELLERVVAGLQQIAKNQQISLHLDLQRLDITVQGDEHKLQEVLANFIDNAVQYSAERSSVFISLQVTADAVEVRIRDHGLGVPEKEQKKLFTKFYRASNARENRPDGSGLGLYLAKKVVDAHDGASLIFESRVGNGSTFGIRFSEYAILPTQEELIIDTQRETALSLLGISSN